MSKASLLGFVEGKSDRFFYGSILRVECEPQSVDYILFSGDEVTGHDGGKSVLLELFDYLRRARALHIDGALGKQAVVFFLDKDVDEFCRVKRRSKHIVYTKPYHVENYFFMHGNLCNAAAVAAGLDPGDVRKKLPVPSVWTSNAAAAWIDWMSICLFGHARLHSSACQYYSRPSSQVHSGPYGTLDVTKLAEFETKLSEESNLDDEGFAKSYARLKKNVARLVSDGDQDLIFKGKWYTAFLVEDINRIAGRKKINKTGLHERLLSALAQSLDFEAEWSAHLREPIRELLQDV